MAKITKAQFIKLQKKHKTDARIGASLGVTRQAIHQLRAKLGVKSLAADNTNRNAKILERYAAGTSGTALAAEFGLSVSQTYRIINAVKTKGKKAVAKASAKIVKKIAKKKSK